MKRIFQHFSYTDSLLLDLFYTENVTGIEYFELAKKVSLIGNFNLGSDLRIQLI